MTDEAITALGKEFERLRLYSHLTKLRAFWRSQHKGGPSEWDEGHVIHLAKMLRVPPYETALEVHPPAWRCPCDGENASHMAQRTVHVLGPFAEIQCTTCRATWLEEVKT